MKFTKMHGCGNDYVYVNCLEETIDNPNELAVKVSDRHFGIGGDGLILIKDSDKADFTMDMYNLDGSQGAMCGNGIRCVGKYVYDHKLTDKTELSIETKAGIKYLSLHVIDGVVDTVTVDMGSPSTKPSDLPVITEKEAMINEPMTAGEETRNITCVSMGNPHGVIFVDDTKSIEIETVGPKWECHERFPDRMNVEFIKVLSRTEIEMRVWERGSGETLACGTGACASVVACVLNGKTDEEVTVHLLGGDLNIRYDQENNKVFMTGPAREVFEGIYEDQ